MIRKTHRIARGSSKKEASAFQKQMESVRCALQRCMLMPVPLEKLPEAKKLARKLTVLPEDAAVLAVVACHPPKISAPDLDHWLKPFLSAPQVRESVLRLRACGMLRMAKHRLIGAEEIRITPEMDYALQTDRVERLEQLAPTGNEGILRFAATLMHHAPLDPEELEVYLDRLFEANEENAFLDYLNHITVLDSVPATFMLFVAAENYYTGKPFALSKLNDVVRYAPNMLHDVRLQIMQSTFPPLEDGTLQWAKGGYASSDPAFEFSPAGIAALFSDLPDFVPNEMGTSGNPALFQSYPGTVPKLVFPPSLQNRLKSVEQLVLPGVYEDFVRSTNTAQKGLVVLAYGESGTGKTAWCHRLLALSQRPYFTLDTKVNSKWVGETSKNLRHVFESYSDYVRLQQKYPVLFINEIETVFSSRSSVQSASEAEMNSIQGELLNRTEQALAEGTIILATSNSVENIDPAFLRRFTDRIFFSLPGLPELGRLWKTYFPALRPFEIEYLLEELGTLSPADIATMAAYWERLRFLESEANSRGLLQVLVEFSQNKGAFAAQQPC